MKIPFLLSCFIISINAWTQVTEHITISKEPQEKDFFPFIEGVYKDEIALEKLGSKQGIQTPLGWQVQSFQIGYSSGINYKILPINSRIIPDTVLLEIKKSCLNEQIYLTRIRAIDGLGIEHEMIPMTLIPIWKEND